MSEFPHSFAHESPFVGAIPTVGVTEKPLGTFCEFKYGRGLPAKDRRGGDFPVYGSNGIVGWHDEPITDGPAIIIGRKGSAGALQYSDLPSCPIDTTYYVDRSCTSVDLKWLFFMLPMLRLDELSKHAAVPGLNRNDAYQIPLRIPPPEEQEKTAAILEKADALRNQRRESLEFTKKLPKAIFHNMFGGGTTPQLRIQELIDSNALLLHKDGNHGSQYPRATDFGPEGIPFISAKHINDQGNLDLKDVPRLAFEKADDLKIGWLEPDDVLLAHNATVGPCALYEGQFERALIGTSLTAFRVNMTEIIPEYLLAALRSEMFQRQLRSVMEQSTRNQVPITAQRSLLLPIPSIVMQERYARISKSIRRISQDIEYSAKDLNSLFLSLQQRAFRGDLDLSRVLLGAQAESRTFSDQRVSAAKGVPPKSNAFLVAPKNLERELDRLSTLIRQDGPMPWSADYFKYRVLGTMPAPFSFDDLMQRARGFFDGEPHYEEIKDIMLELLGQGGASPLLRQRFDLTINEGANENSGSKQIVFEPVS